jgi:hypothetical protein
MTQPEPIVCICELCQDLPEPVSLSEWLRDPRRSAEDIAEALCPELAALN